MRRAWLTGMGGITTACTRPRIALLSSARLGAVGIVCTAGDAGRLVAFESEYDIVGCTIHTRTSANLTLWRLRTMKKKLMSSALTVTTLASTSVGLPHQGRTPAKPGAQSQACKMGSNDKIRKMVEKKVKQIVIEELGVDEAEVTPNARLIDDLGADSLDTVEIIMRVEEEFGIEIPDEDAETLQRVCDASAYIEKRMRQAKGKARRVQLKTQPNNSLNPTAR